MSTKRSNKTDMVIAAVWFSEGLLLGWIFWG